MKNAPHQNTPSHFQRAHQGTPSHASRYPLAFAQRIKIPPRNGSNHYKIAIVAAKTGHDIKIATQEGRHPPWVTSVPRPFDINAAETPQSMMARTVQPVILAIIPNILIHCPFPTADNRYSECILLEELLKWHHFVPDYT